MENQNPRFIDHYPLSQVFVRFLVGGISGIFGSLFLGIAMFLTWNILKPLLYSQIDIDGSVITTQLDPIVVIIIGLFLFLATMVSNMIYTLFISVVDDKFEERKMGMSFVFIGGLILFLFMIPLYIYLSFFALETQGMAISGLLQVILFNIYTVMALEIVNRNKYLIVSLIGLMIGIIFFTGVISIIFSAGGQLAITILLIQPILMASTAITNSIAEGVYGWYYKTYGSDGLSQYQETYEHEENL